MKRLVKNKTCEHKECLKGGTQLVYLRQTFDKASGEQTKPRFKQLCSNHRKKYLQDWDGPEYQVECPNCGCFFGVN